MRKHRVSLTEEPPENPDENDLLDIYRQALTDIREEVRDSWVFDPVHMTVFIHHINDILEDISDYMPD